MHLDKKTVEQWAEEKEIEPWLFAAAKAGHRWPEGRELTEEQFDEAVRLTEGVRIGYDLTKQGERAPSQPPPDDAAHE